VITYIARACDNAMQFMLRHGWGEISLLLAILLWHCQSNTNSVVQHKVRNPKRRSLGKLGRRDFEPCTNIYI